MHKLKFMLGHSLYFNREENYFCVKTRDINAIGFSTVRVPPQNDFTKKLPQSPSVVTSLRVKFLKIAGIKRITLQKQNTERSQAH